MTDSVEDDLTDARQMKNEIIKDTKTKETKLRVNTETRQDRYGKCGTVICFQNNERQTWDKIAETQEKHLSDVITAYATVGRYFLQQHNPVESGGMEPTTIEELTKQNIPKKRSSAATVSEVIGFIVEDLKQITMRELAENERIQQDGEQFYRGEQ